MEKNQQQFAYDVFLSYRHKPLDAAVTQKVFNLLEGYRLPKTAVREGKNKIARAFRDTEELSVSGILSDTIVKALSDTRCLVVVCSPDTPSSEWVDREVGTFIEMGRAEYVYALLIGGDEETSFPPSLKMIPDIDQRTLHAENPKNEYKAIIRTAREELLAVIARCCGCPHQELLRAHRLRKRSRSAALMAGSLAIFACIAGVSGVLWAKAEKYRETAQAEQAATMDMVNSLTYDLPSALVNIQGTYSRLEDILVENIAQIETILTMAKDPEIIAREKAVNNEKLASVYGILGNSKKAIAHSRQAYMLYNTLYQQTPDDKSLADLASAYNNLGNTMNATGDYSGAGECYEQAIRLQKKLTEDDAAENLASYYNNYGMNLASQGKDTEAVGEYERSVKLRARLARAGAPGAGSALAATYLNMGVSFEKQADYGMAENNYMKAIAQCQKEYENRGDLLSVSQLSGAYATLASCYNAQANHELAQEYFDKAVALQEEAANDRENTAAQDALAATYNNIGLSFNMSGDFTEAADYYGDSLKIRQKLYNLDQTTTHMANLARIYYNIAENELDVGQYGQARTNYDRGLSLYEDAYPQLGDFHEAAYWARVSYYETVFTQNRGKALEASEKAMALMPDSSFVNWNHLYALMYAGKDQEALLIAEKLALRSAGEVSTVKDDFRMLRAKGLSDPLMVEIEIILK